MLPVCVTVLPESEMAMFCGCQLMIGGIVHFRLIVPVHGIFQLFLSSILDNATNTYPFDNAAAFYCFGCLLIHQGHQG